MFHCLYEHNTQGRWCCGYTNILYTHTRELKIITACLNITLTASVVVGTQTFCICIPEN